MAVRALVKVSVNFTCDYQVFPMMNINRFIVSVTIFVNLFTPSNIFLGRSPSSPANESYLAAVGTALSFQMEFSSQCKNTMLPTDYVYLIATPSIHYFIVNIPWTMYCDTFRNISFISFSGFVSLSHDLSFKEIQRINQMSKLNGVCTRLIHTPDDL